MNDNKINFLYSAINDTQATIRATDVKIGFLFVVEFSPLFKLNEIVIYYNQIREIQPAYCLPASIVTILWILAILLLFAALRPKSNPKKTISSEMNVKSAYYDGALFKINFWDQFWASEIKSEKKLEEKIGELPQDKNETIKELTFELMKLSYIRDLKMKRSSSCIDFTFLWILFGGTTWLTSLLKVGF